MFSAALFCDDASTIEGKDEEESSDDEPVVVGVGFDFREGINADDDANDDDDDDGK